MDRAFDNYCDAVCEELHHATRREKESVAQELRDHLNDHADELIAIGRTESDVPLHLGSIALPTLSENENAVVWCLHRFHPLTGWYSAAGCAADCSGDTPFSAAYGRVFDRQRKDSSEIGVFFGRVLDARIVSLEIRMLPVTDNRPMTVPDEGLLMARRDGLAPASETFCIYVKNPGRYSVAEDGTELPFRPWLLCYDADGVLLWSEEITNGWTTIMNL